MKLFVKKEDIANAILPMAQLVENGEMSAENFSKWAAGYIEGLVGWNPVFVENNDGYKPNEEDKPATTGYQPRDNVVGKIKYPPGPRRSVYGDMG